MSEFPPDRDYLGELLENDPETDYLPMDTLSSPTSAPGDDLPSQSTPDDTTLRQKLLEKQRMLALGEVISRNVLYQYTNARLLALQALAEAGDYATIAQVLDKAGDYSIVYAVASGLITNYLHSSDPHKRITPADFVRHILYRINQD